PGYQPQTVSVDGWAATAQAWRALFPLVVLLRCFLHGWLAIRSRGKLSAAFVEVSGEGWQAFPAPGRRRFAPPPPRARGAGAGAGADGVAGRTGGEAVRAGAGVRGGVPPPRRAPHQHHAGPGDAVDEPLLRGRAALAWVGAGLRGARPGVGAVA